MNLKSTLAACTIAVTCMLSVVGGSQAQSADATPTTQSGLSVEFRSCKAIDSPENCSPVNVASFGVTNTDTGEHFDLLPGDHEGTYFNFSLTTGTYELDTVPGDAIDDSRIYCALTTTSSDSDQPVEYPVVLGSGDGAQCLYIIVPTNAKGNPAPTTPAKPAPTKVAVASLPNTGAGADDSGNGSADALALIGAATVVIGAATVVIGAAGVALKRRASFEA